MKLRNIKKEIMNVQFFEGISKIKKQLWIKLLLFERVIYFHNHAT